MTAEELLGRLVNDKRITFLVHEDGATFLVIDEACWLDAEETEPARQMLLGLGARVPTSPDTDRSETSR